MLVGGEPIFDFRLKGSDPGFESLVTGVTDLTALSTSRSMTFSMLLLSRSKTCSTIFVMKSCSCDPLELLGFDSLILFVEIFEGLESSEERVFPLDNIFFF